MKTIIIDGVPTQLTDKEIEINGRDISEHTKCGLCSVEIEDGDTASVAEHINPENDQRLCTDLCHTECLEDDDAEQTLTLTSRYHSWSNTIADQFYNSVVVDNITRAEFEEEAKIFRESASRLSHSVYDIDMMVDEIIAKAEGAILCAGGFSKTE
jgi:hypothetical protein